jgi:hypothetical protein
LSLREGEGFKAPVDYRYLWYFRKAEHTTGRSIPLRKNIPLFRTQNRCHNTPILPGKRGGSRSSRNRAVGCEGTLRRQACSSCRAKRLRRTAKSCGPGAATVASIRPACAGSATVARNAVHRGEHEVNRQTFARGRPGCPGCTCQTRVRFCLPIAHGDAGAVGAWPSLRPFDSKGPPRWQQPGRNRAAGMIKHVSSFANCLSVLSSPRPACGERPTRVSAAGEGSFRESRC